jgi:iron(III) transport system ATP-binding protein
MRTSKGVTIQNLSKVYLTPKGTEFKAVNNISTEIRPGEFVTLLGPSGCGKTTTLRMIAGFEVPTAGDIFLGGVKINDLTPDKRDSAMVFQSYALFPHLNIRDNIAYGLRVKKLSNAVINPKVEEIIKLIGLEGMESRSPDKISGGQQQRVALARALVMEPGVLLFDEPLSNLDAKLRIYMRTEIRRIQKQVGITAIYVTHDQGEAMSLSDRIIIMNQGVIEQVGTPEEIYYKPQSEFVAGFIGTANFLKAEILEVADGKATIDTGKLRLKVDYDGKRAKGETCKIVLRPEAISIGEHGKLTAKVTMSTFMGNVQEYQVLVGDQELRVEDANPQGRRVYKEGDEVRIDFNEANIHMI